MTVEQHNPSPLTLEVIAGLARETLLEDGKHPPTLIAEGALRTGVIELGDLGRSHDERIQHLAKVGYKMATEEQAGQLQQAFLITEAWMAFASDGNWPDLPLSKNENRKEVLIVSQFDAHRLEGSYVMYEMKRTPDGHLLELVEFPLADGEGRQTDNRLLAAFAMGFQMGDMERRRR